MKPAAFPALRIGSPFARTAPLAARAETASPFHEVRIFVSVDGRGLFALAA